jgi:ribosomal protein S18 acetylase RimI-like enzyme
MSKEIRQMIDKVKSFKQFVNESVTDKKFIVKNHKFELLIDSILVAESKFNIESEDEFFNEKYLSIYELETFEQFRGKGYARLLLEEIFNYVKNTLKLNTITLIVDKVNHKAVNLYFNTGFEIFMEYEDSYSLVKKL